MDNKELAMLQEYYITYIISRNVTYPTLDGSRYSLLMVTQKANTWDDYFIDAVVY